MSKSSGLTLAFYDPPKPWIPNLLQRKPEAIVLLSFLVVER